MRKKVFTKTASLATNSNDEQVIMLTFPYDLDTLFFVRSLAGRKYHKAERCWSLPIFKETLITLVDYGFILDEYLLEILNDFKTNKDIIEKDGGIPGLKGELYPFQTEGVAFIESTKGRTLIADEMGLGKTVQALSWLQLHPEKRPAVIVVPASLKFNWEREAKRWMTNPKMEILSGTLPHKTKTDIIIINYDILYAWVDKLKLREIQVLIADECHLFKSNKARRTKAIKQLAKGIPHIIGLTGTPVLNRPVEIYNIGHMLNPELFPNFDYFTRYFCDRKITRFGWDISGASHTKELHALLTSTIMLRRLKKDVLRDLPSKTRAFVPLEIHNRTVYKAAEADFIGFIRQSKGIEAAERASNALGLTKFEGLKQLAVHGKMDGVIQWIKEFLEVEDKLVVFAIHKSTIERLMYEFKNIAVKLDGSTSMSDRQRVVDSFQADKKIKLFIGNVQAAGIGITLTAASNIAFLELPWTPGELVQAEDRCHRIGQKYNVTVHYLFAKGTIEEDLADIIDTKQIVLDALIDGRPTSANSLLTLLIKKYESNSYQSR